MPIARMNGYQVSGVSTTALTTDEDLHIVAVRRMDNCMSCHRPLPEDQKEYENTVVNGGYCLCEKCQRKLNVTRCERCGGKWVHTDLREVDVSDDGDGMFSWQDSDEDETSEYEDETSSEADIMLLCPNCRRKPGDPSPNVIGSGKGDIVKSERIFGVEIECSNPNLSNLNRLPKSCGKGTDGSVDDNGTELRTPKLCGKVGENYIRTVCKVARNAECYVDSSAGLHVHINAPEFWAGGASENALKDVDGEKAERLIALLSWYVRNERTIQSFLPKSRIGSKYAKTIRRYFKISAVKKLPHTIAAFEELWYMTKNTDFIKRCKLSGNQGHNSRYLGLNLHSLLANGHAEIRYHSGTLNPNKILHWVALHVAILDWAAQKPRDRKYPTKEQRKLTDPIDRARVILDTLNLTEETKKYLIGRVSLFQNPSIKETQLDEPCAG